MATIDITTVKGQDALKPRQDPYYQKVAKGLAVGLYKPGTGTQSWIARVRHEDRYRTKALDPLEVTTYPEAVAAATAYAAQVRAGEAPSREQRAIAKKADMTVRELVAEYIDSMAPTKGERFKEWSYTTNRLAKGYVHPTLGDTRIGKVDQEAIRNLQNDLRTQVSAETVNRALVPLRASLNYAFAQGYLTSAPWKAVPLLEEAEHGDKANAKEYFPLEAREAFLEAAGEHLAAICQCMHLTGCRPSEARRLTVGDVHVGAHGAKFVRFKTFKGNRQSGTSRKFPLSNGRLEFFRDAAKGRQKSEPLFPTPKGAEWSMANLSKYHNKVRDELDLDGFQTYCWRHATITDWVNDNVRPLTVAKLVGTSLRFIQDNYTAGDETLADQLPEI